MRIKYDNDSPNTAAAAPIILFDALILFEKYLSLCLFDSERERTSASHPAYSIRRNAIFTLLEQDAFDTYSLKHCSDRYLSAADDCLKYGISDYRWKDVSVAARWATYF